MLWSDSGSGGIKGGLVGDEMTEGGERVLRERERSVPEMVRELIYIYI